MHVYIRHGTKEHSNNANKAFSLDAGITDEGKLIAQERFKQIFHDYFIPDIIISSPYLRTRETSEIAQKVLEKHYNTKVNVIVDVLLGEYLGNQKHKDLCDHVVLDTLKYNPIGSESWKQYSCRIKYFVSKEIKDYKNILFISHGLTIQSISYFLDRKIDYPKELCGFSYYNDKVTEL